MDGEHALEFARERYAFAEGDRQRGANQQHVIEALIKKYTEPGTLLKYGTILDSLSDAIRTNMPAEQIKLLVDGQISDMRGWDVQSVAADGEGAMLETYSMPGQKLWVMIPDESTITAAKARIQEVMDGK
jgi:anionic cell wall polymer biosynthesis LytR-Cps2A-Psr (LCP) family protein